MARSARSVLLIVVVTALASVSGRAAAVCGRAPSPAPRSPSAQPAFVGRMLSAVAGGTNGTRYLFDVETVQSGEVTDPADVDISVITYGRDASGRVATVGSSAGAIAPPQEGARYRVEAYVGRPNGERRLFIGECGGSLQFLAPPSRGLPMRPVIATSVAAALALAVLLRLRASSVIRPPVQTGV
jgi:hypothetical protein